MRGRVMRSFQGDEERQERTGTGVYSKKAGNRRRKGEKRWLFRTRGEKRRKRKQSGVAKKEKEEEKEEAKGIGENERRTKEEKKRGGVSGRAHTGWRRRQCGSTGGERCSERGKRVVGSREGNK